MLYFEKKGTLTEIIAHLAQEHDLKEKTFNKDI